MQAVDRDLDLGLVAARSLAMASEIDRKDFASFYEKAKEVVSDDFPGSNFVLSTPDSVQILNTLRPFGATIPDPISKERIRRVLDTGAPVISDMFIGGATGRPLVAVHVPVLRQGRVLYVLSVGYLPEQLGQPLRKQHLAPNRVAGVFDRRGILIARSHEAQRFVGKPGSAELVKRMLETDEDVIESVTLEGIPVYSMFSRSSRTGWSVAIGVPRASILQEVLSSVMWLTWLILGLLLIGFGGAWVISRRVTRTVHSLSLAARKIGNGELAIPAQSEFREADVVAVTLQTASRELLQHRQNLELLIQERTAQLERTNEQLALERDKSDAANALLRDAERQASSKELRTRAVVESVGEGIVTIDEHGTIETFNGAASRIFGYAADEVIGENITKLMPADLRTKHTAGMVRYLETGEPHIVGKSGIELPALRKDGSLFTVELTVNAVGTGERTLFVGILRDVTEHRRTQAELRQAVHDARAAESAKSSFLANMSHELRTPMNAVLGMAHLMAMSPLAPEQRKHLEMLRISGQSLLALLNDILDLSKIEAGKIKVSTAHFELEAVLKAVATIMSVNAGEKDLELCMGIAPQAPKVLVGDALRLQQILVNLTGNAIKFTPSGEVTLDVDCLSCEKGDISLSFIVRDTGIGISLEQKAKLFNPFVQADASTTREYGGTGLGLVICKRLIEIMGGTIAVDSSPGVGSTFTVTLPFQAGDALGEQRTDDEPIKRVLLLDNSETARSFAIQALSARRWTVDVATSCDEAEKLALQFQSSGQKHDVILADWSLPFDQKRQLEQWWTEGFNGIPVLLMMSAIERTRLAQAHPGLETSGIVIKPFTPSMLFDALYDILNSKPSVDAPELAVSQRLPFKLLLAEDNPMNQLVAVGVLERFGATVDVANNGAEAIKVLQANPNKYQLVLMDVQMPVMDGFTATRILREELGISIPVLAMTAGVTDTEREQCLAAGMDDFIAKPLDMDEMLETIERHLRHTVQAARTE